MYRYFIGYLATAFVFCVIDFVWLGAIAVDFYRTQLGPLLLERPNFSAAVLFYVLYIAGIQFFAVKPAHGKLGIAAQNGALFGFFNYMTYDLTNLATLNGWSNLVVIADIVWGTALTAIAATAGSAATKLFATRDSAEK